MSTPMIAGLYQYARGGIVNPPSVTLAETVESLVVNPAYRTDLTVLAGDPFCAGALEGFGLRVAHVFEDAPPDVVRDSAHKMKHWMCRWALREFGEFLWVDWDTVMIRPPDAAFWEWCRSAGTPKFIRIPNYWATVNCGVYYAGSFWADSMDRSFQNPVTEPNDELMWASVLPDDVTARPEFWWGKRARHIQSPKYFDEIGPDCYFAHVKELHWAPELRRRAFCQP